MNHATRCMLYRTLTSSTKSLNLVTIDDAMTDSSFDSALIMNHEDHKKSQCNAMRHEWPLIYIVTQNPGDFM